MRWRAPYRSLALVYGLAILAGAFEIVRDRGRPRREPDIYGDPVRNFPEAMARLYPGTAEAEYLLGRRCEATAGRNIRRDELERDPALFPRFLAELKVNLEEAAGHYERAIALGMKSEENLYYYYALTLVRLQADPDRIDRAIADWRRNFPYSGRRDLQLRRKAIEEELRQLQSALDSTGASQGQREEREVTADPAELDGNHPLPHRGKVGGENAAALDDITDWRSPPGYTGSEACRKCHPDQFQSYGATAHNRALADVDADSEPPDGVFDHAASGRRYRVTRRQGRLIHGESLILDDGAEFALTSAPVWYRVGSGRFARTYLCDRGDGFLTESPVTWYETAHAWGMTPGFDKPAHRSFSRQILENCLWCHSGRTEMSATSNFRLRVVENAIGCERCHGPGAAHVEAHSREQTREEDADRTIVNPARLSRILAEAVCQQCHLQGDIHIGGRRLRAVDYRPGQPLEKFATVYRLRRGETGMTVVGHVEQLQASSCYRQSSTMTCVTCHDPHAPVAPEERIEHYRSVCLSCHAGDGCKLGLAVREERSGNDCVRCHMPQSDTEVPHVAFTHHHIAIHPLREQSTGAQRSDPLVALSDLSGLNEPVRHRSLMLARLQMFLMRGPDFQQSDPGQHLAASIDKWLRGLKPEEVDAETEFARFQFLSARGDLRGAEQSAARALAAKDLRSEEEAAVLEQLAHRDIAAHRFVEARARFERLSRLRCRGPDWYFLGRCEAKLGRSEAALRALERALQLEPADGAIYEALAAVYHARKEFEPERRVTETAARLSRRQPPPAQDDHR